MFTVYDGKRTKSANTLIDAEKVAQTWSRTTHKVISLFLGSTTYSYFYHGREISGKLANEVWKRELYVGV